MTKRVIPDYTNQLDLFSEAGPETPAPVLHAPARTSRSSQGRPQAPEQLRFGEWVPLAPFDAGSGGGQKPGQPNTGGAGGKDRQPPPVRTDIGAQDGEPPRITTAVRRGFSAGRVFDIEPEEKPSRDFRITGAHRIGQGGLHQKARDNIAAIRLLKTLEAENREATDDEKPVIARYVGCHA
jgi:hypothetical protein